MTTKTVAGRIGVVETNKAARQDGPKRWRAKAKSAAAAKPAKPVEKPAAATKPAPNPAPRATPPAATSGAKKEAYPDYFDTKTLRIVGRRMNLERRLGKPVEEMSRYQLMNEILLASANAWVRQLLHQSEKGAALPTE